MKRLFFVLTIALILTVGLATVSAAENVSGTLDLEVSADEASLEVTDALAGDSLSEVRTPGGATFEDIQSAIDNSSDGDTIELNGNYAGTGNVVTISKNVNIVGSNGTVLDASGLSAIFKLKAKNITLRGLTFINSNGSAILDNDYYSGLTGDYRIVDCSFANNTADRGGAMEIICNSLSIEGCSFTNNTGKEVGAVYGTMYNCTIAGSVFKDNGANSIGAARVISKNCTVTNSIFEGNSARCVDDGYGVGAFQCEYLSDYDCNFSIVNCSFSRNSVVANISTYNSGAVFVLGYLSVSNSSFTANSVSGMDGGMYATALFHTYSDFSLNVSGCNFAENVGYSGYEGYSGGAITTDSADFAIWDTNFTQNRATVGAAIHSSSIRRMANCNFINNYAASETIVEVGTLNATGCRFINNTAKSRCGAISLFNGVLNRCTFENNEANNAGAIKIMETLDINDCTFRNNNAKNYGSVMVCYSNAKVTMSNSVLAGNVAGGGKNNFGWPIINYANGAITCVNTGVFKAVNTTGIVSNTDKFKQNTILSASSITVVYKGSKSLVATVTNDFNKKPIKGLKVQLTIKSKKVTATTDKNGDAKLSISAVPGKYSATVTCLGDNFYKKSSKTVTVTVKKASPKISASKMTFKKSVKTKKYTATLKNVDGSAVSSKKLTLKVNGVTYSAKTNSKGTATFKITKLSKKGTYKATVTYKGDSCYNKVSKTVKLTVK